MDNVENVPFCSLKGVSTLLWSTATMAIYEITYSIIVSIMSMILEASFKKEAGEKVSQWKADKFHLTSYLLRI